MTSATFDTLGYFEKLKAAGVPEAQAKAITDAQVEVLKDFVSARELATKADIQGLRDSIATKAEIMATKAELAAVENRLLRWMVGGFITQSAFIVAVLALLRQ